MNAHPSLTKPVLRALRILCSEGRVRVSNVTKERGPRVSANGPRQEPCIYWQSWRQLEELGYGQIQPGTNCYGSPTPAARRRLALEDGER